MLQNSQIGYVLLQPLCPLLVWDEEFISPTCSRYPAVLITSSFEQVHQVEPRQATAVFHHGPKQTVTCGLIIAWF